MRKIYFIVSLILAVTACTTISKTDVSVHVEGMKADTEISLVTKDSVYKMSTDSTGSAKVTLGEKQKAGYASIRFGRANIPVYIEPGKGFDLSIKFEGRRMTPLFTGVGAAKNEYLNGESFRKLNPDFKAEEATFMTSMKEQEDQLFAALDSLAFDNQFVTLEKKRIHYLVYAALTNYPSYYSYYSQNNEYKPSEDFYKNLQGSIAEEEELIDIPEYQQTYLEAIRLIAVKDIVDYKSWDITENTLKYAQNNIQSPAIAEYVVDRVISDYVGRSGVDRLAELAPIYNAKVNSTDKKTVFDELCAKWAKVAKGEAAPNFKYMDINGKEVALSDLAGKYVYIDVWATWCGPCRNEIPYLKTLEHKMQKNNIHFVSISCDQNKETWEKMVKDEKLGGIQLHSGGDNSFMDTFMIRGIPRFILLDREGKIVASEMSRPSNSETMKTLQALEGI